MSDDFKPDIFFPEEVEAWELDQLKPYEANPRLHSEGQVALIAAGIVEFGFTNPIQVREDGEIISGHGRFLAAKELGLEKVPVLVQRHLDEEKSRACRISDNRSSDLSDWDDSLLLQELGAVRESGMELFKVGFTETEFDNLTANPFVPNDDLDDLSFMEGHARSRVTQRKPSVGITYKIIIPEGKEDTEKMVDMVDQLEKMGCAVKRAN